MLSIFKKKKIVATHNGTFHADDLFACAALSLWHAKRGEVIKIVRTRDMRTIEAADIVVDVGGLYDPNTNRYDHHQKEGAGTHANGIPYAAFGLVWKHFGLDLCNGNRNVWEEIDRDMVIPLDAADNGVDLLTLKYEGISPYNGARVFLIDTPTWKENGKNLDKIFIGGVARIVHTLAREIEVAMANEEGRQILMKAYEASADKRIVVLDTPYEFSRYLYQDVFSRLPEPIYFVYPSGHCTNWKVEAITKSPATLESRKLLPEAWRGFMDSDKRLAEVTGVSDALFCHRSGFLMTATSKASALVLAQKALEA